LPLKQGQAAAADDRRSSAGRLAKLILSHEAAPL